MQAYMELNPNGKRVLMTGASKSIGRACVEVLANEGCTVLGVSRNIAPGPTMKAATRSARPTPLGCILTIDSGLAARSA